MKAIFKKGFMYRVSCSPESLIYISESKTLAGKEVRGREDEAMGRPLVLTFFKRDARGLAHRVDNGTSVLKLKTLTLAVLLQTLGHVLPLDPDRTSATAELLLEAHYWPGDLPDAWAWAASLREEGVDPY